jgi:branched-chain amino acid transport system permease protein
MMLGLVAIVVMLAAPKGIWGLIAARSGFSVFPLERKVLFEELKPARE